MSKLRSTLALLLLIAAILVSLPLVLGFLGTLHPAFDAFAHFRAHLAVLMGAMALLLLFTRMKREAAMILLLAVMAFSTTLSGTSRLMGRSAADANAAPAGARYSLLQINLLFDNPDPKRLVQLIGRERPDIITYQEAGSVWTSWLDILKGSYPFRHECKLGDYGWGVGILSRRPFAEGAQSLCSEDGTLAMATFNFGGSPAMIAAFHSRWPWPYRQPQQIADAEPLFRQINGPAIIAGDFNSAPWSQAVRHIEQMSNTNHMAGIGPTWLTTDLPAAWRPFIGLPIDQLLVSPAIEAPKVRTLPDAGSDHLPVRLEFSVPPPQSKPEQAPVQAVMLQ